MSVKKVIASGNMNKEIEKLLADKEKANKAGDQGKARLIRRQLRKLGYKRAVEKGDVEAPKSKAAPKPGKKVEKKLVKKPIKKVVEASEDDDTEE